MKCSFCNTDIAKGRATIFAKKDGTVYYYCSSKCEKNANMGRTPRKTAWVTKKKK